MFVRLNESGVRVVYKAKVTRLNHYTFDIERKSALARIIHTNNGRLTWTGSLAAKQHGLLGGFISCAVSLNTTANAAFLPLSLTRPISKSGYQRNNALNGAHKASRPDSIGRQWKSEAKLIELPSVALAPPPTFLSRYTRGPHLGLLPILYAYRVHWSINSWTKHFEWALLHFLSIRRYFWHL